MSGQGQISDSSNMDKEAENMDETPSSPAFSIDPEITDITNIPVSWVIDVTIEDLNELMDCDDILDNKKVTCPCTLSTISEHSSMTSSTCCCSSEMITSFDQNVDEVITKVCQSFLYPEILDTEANDFGEKGKVWITMTGSNSRLSIKSEESPRPASYASSSSAKAAITEAAKMLVSHVIEEAVTALQSTEAVITLEAKTLEVTEAVKTLEATEAVTTQQSTEAVKTLQSIEAVKTLEATEAVKALEATEAVKTLQSTEAVTIQQSTEAVKTLQSIEAVKTLEVTEAVKALEATEAVKTLQSTEAVTIQQSTEAVKTLQSIEAVKTLEVTEAVKALEATEAVKTLQSTEAVKTLEATGPVKIIKDSDAPPQSDLSSSSDWPLVLNSSTITALIRRFFQSLSEEQWREVGESVYNKDVKEQLTDMCTDVLRFISESVAKNVLQAICQGHGSTSGTFNLRSPLSSSAPLNENLGIIEYNMQRSLESSFTQAFCDVVGADTPGRISPKFTEAIAREVIAEVNSVLSVAIQASLDGGSSNITAAASCLLSKDRVAKNTLEGAITTMKSFLTGRGTAIKRRIQTDNGSNHDSKEQTLAGGCNGKRKKLQWMRWFSGCRRKKIQAAPLEHLEDEETCRVFRNIFSKNEKKMKKEVEEEKNKAPAENQMKRPSFWMRLLCCSSCSSWLDK